MALRVILILTSFVYLGLGCLNKPADLATPSGEPAISRQAGYPEVTGLDTQELRSYSLPEGSERRIKFNLSSPAAVRIRILDGREPGIILRTLLNWELLGSGQQEIKWDGMDWRGELAINRSPGVSIVAEPRRSSVDAAGLMDFEKLRHPYIKHILHPVESCGDLAVRISIPEAGAVVSGLMVVEAMPIGQIGMPAGEYHVAVFIDGRPAWDGRVKQPRITEYFDTRNIPNGEYSLAVTFSDLNDHAGSDWTRIIIENP